MSLKKLIEEKRYVDLFLLSRFMKRMGRPIVNEEQYKFLEDGMAKQGIMGEYLSRTLEEDPIPYKLLLEFSLEESINIDLIEDEQQLEDLFIISRFMYRIGSPIINDKSYDTLEKIIKSKGLIKHYTSRTYDDDPVPYALLREVSLEKFIPTDLISSKYMEYIDKEKSLSIQPFEDAKEVYNFLMEKKQDIVAMLKIDGTNVKNYYRHLNLEIGMSRGRNGTGFDWTRNISKIIPSKIEAEYDELKIFGEAFVYEQHLPYFRERYEKDKYKTPKSSAISMLRVEHDIGDYDKLDMLAFNVEGATHLKTKMEMLEYLKTLGYKVVPHVLIKWETIPKDYNTFKKWLDGVCKQFYVRTQMLPSDGLVFEVNNLFYEDAISAQYSNKNIAVKLSYWSSEKYIGVVEDILIEQQRVVASCRIKIRPLRTKDGCEANYVSGYTPNVIINNGIVVGSEVEFERKSGAINSLLYGDKLKE
ncbi:hypothetical protein UT300012_22990 [Paraclostridium bifermentans]